MRRLRQSLAVILAIAGLNCDGIAQNAGPNITFKSDVNLVLIDATVRDHNGRVASGLLQSNFRLFQDGNEQPIRIFSESHLPLAIAIVVDRSGSMQRMFADLRDSAVRALNALYPQDRVVLFAFDRRVERLTQLTTDRWEIARAFAQLEPGGGTDILDALYEAAGYLKMAAPKDRRAVLLISDNISYRQMNRRREQDIVDAALKFETDIHSIQVRLGFGLSLPLFGMPGGDMERVSISQITKNTGGEITHSNSGSVGKTLAEVLDRIRKRYTLGYYAPQSQPGEFHRIEVRLVDAGNKPLHEYTISSRTGFYSSR